MANEDQKPGKLKQGLGHSRKFRRSYDNWRVHFFEPSGKYAHQKLGLTLPLTQRLDHVTPTALDLIACTHCSVIPDPKQFYLCDNCDVCICKDCATFDSDADLGLQKLSLQGNGDPRSHSAACQCALPKLRRAPPKILEVLLEMTAWTCENAERGCTEVIRWSNLEKHAKYCKYRKF